MESRVRQMTNHAPVLIRETPSGIPFITQEELQELLKHDDEIQTSQNP
jgi:hypothetical protein